MPWFGEGEILGALKVVKLVVFAHTPPPHHGQSYMVQLLLESLRNNDTSQNEARSEAAAGIEVYHVNARLSQDVADIGRAQWGKLFLVLKYCAQAIWFRFRHGADCLYYVPANPARVAIYRDWLVLGLCRPFFRRVVYHWHAAGEGEWLLHEARPWERWVSRLICGQPDLSIVIKEFNRRDAEVLESRKIAVIPYGLPDPCPEFSSELLPRRLARVAARQSLLKGASTVSPAAGLEPHFFNLLYIGLCFSEKGLFDAVEAVALSAKSLKNSPLRIRLLVAGSFWEDAERARFEKRIQEADLQDSQGPLVEYRGFVGGADKKRLFVEADALCFPTYYNAESFGLVLLEAMAFGLPIITTHWRGIPELLPPHQAGIVDPKSPEQIAAAAIAYLDKEYDPGLRAWFLAHYTTSKFAENMKQALGEL